MKDILEVKNIIKILLAIGIMVFLVLFGINYKWVHTVNRDDIHTLVEDVPITICFIVFLIGILTMFVLILYYCIDNDDCFWGNFDEKLPKVVLIITICLCLAINAIQSLAFDYGVYMVLGFGTVALLSIGAFVGIDYVIENWN